MDEIKKQLEIIERCKDLLEEEGIRNNFIAFHKVCKTMERAKRKRAKLLVESIKKSINH